MSEHLHETSLITVSLPPRRRRHASRGQALILAVLIMFLLVGLSGLFIAMISQALVQTARANDRDRLEDIALAGLSVAQNALLNSADGADWQPDNNGPDPGNPGWVHYGDGFYKVTVHYGPTTTPADGKFLTNPLEKFIQVNVDARYALPNPTQLDADDPERDAYVRGFLSGKRFLTRKVSQLIPIGITDYLLWVTNLDGSPEPVVFGTSLPLKEMNLDAANQGTLTENYYPLYDGPVRFDSDVTLGDVALCLTSKNAADDADATTYTTLFNMSRYDQFIATGSVGALPSLTLAKYTTNHAAAMATGTNISGSADLELVQSRGSNPVIRSLDAPRLDQRDRTTGLDRYRALTRDSGEWVAALVNRDDSLGAYSGVAGLGDGIYIDNTDDIQYGGDRDALVDEWMDASSNNGCWKDGVYDPVEAGEAVELVLHDWTVGAGNSWVKPYIELRSNDPFAFYDETAAKWTGSVRRDYPTNGVIFAEGNLVVKGNLPASLKVDAGVRDALHPGGWHQVNGKNVISYYVAPTNRRYDLTIVSGGTIYIDGSVLGPSTRDAASYPRGSELDSKLALMALDNVCLNPTKLVEISGGDAETIGGERVWRVTHGRPLTASFSAADAQPTLLLRDAGESREPLSDDYTVMRMAVNGVYREWTNATGSDEDTKFYFCDATLRATFFPWIDVANQWDVTMYPLNVFRHVTLGGGTFLGLGQQNVMQFELSPESAADYFINAGSDLLGPGVTLSKADVQVDALIYAQRGSWFVLPGRYYNDDPALSISSPFPQYREPLDVHIRVCGAIVQNRPAPPAAEQAWTMHWRGGNEAYYSSGTTVDPTKLDPAQATWSPAAWSWTDRRLGIDYHYDATLAHPVCFTRQDIDGTVNYFPRLPKLPVSPTVFSFGALRGA